MAYQALENYPARTELPRWLVVGFVSGAASVLVFHQGAAALLYALELTTRAPYSMQPTSPLGVPQIWSIAFWGGVWGAILAATFGRLDGARLLAAALVFGAVFPTLVAWFIVFPMKGMPVGNGWQPASMLTGVLVNGAWGIGTAFFLNRLPGALRNSRGNM